MPPQLLRSWGHKNKVYNGYHGTSEIKHGLYACTVDNLLAIARGLSLRTGAQTILYLSLDLSLVSSLKQTQSKESMLKYHMIIFLLV